MNNEFGLKYRFPAEKLPLNDDDEIHVPAEVVAVLTNFQLDAIRFLWSGVKDQTHCFLNDGRHMGKRISLVALIAALVSAPKEARVLIACDKDEAIVSWMFKLGMFLGTSSPHVYTAKSIRQGNDSPVAFVNFKQVHLNTNTIRDNRISLLVVDVGSATTRDLNWGLDASMDCCVIACSSDVQVQKRNLLDGLFRKSTDLVQWKTLRRTNEEHLREFPWMDQNQFRKKFEDWRAKRSVQEIFNNTHPKSAIIAPKPLQLTVTLEENEEEVIADKDTSTTLLTGPVKELDIADDRMVFEESQEMSQLVLETDDEMTPIKQDVRRSVQTQSNHLLSSMYLRLSQSFATHTPKQRCVTPTAQDSPDLFASIINDNDDDDEDMDMEDNVDENTPNAFEKSTPLSVSTQNPLDIAASQSPIYSLLPLPDLSPETPELNDTLANKSDQLFEITTNEVFASKMKITTSQKHRPVVEDEEGKLKFDTPENNIFNTPSRKGKTSQKYSPVGEDEEEKLKFDSPENNIFNTPSRKSKKSSPSPGSSGWLSKRGPRVRTPEKVLAKKRKSLLQFYSGKSPPGSGNLDFSTLDDEATQRWNAC